MSASAAAPAHSRLAAAARRLLRPEVAPLAAALVAAAAAAWKSDVVWLQDSAGDEGQLLSGGARVARGEVPYSDFVTILTPGSFQLLALAFRLFGESFAVARAVHLAVFALLLAAFLGLAARAGASPGWRVAGVLALFVAGPGDYWAVVSHHWIADALVLLSAWLLLRAPERPRRADLLLAGATGGLALMVLQDQGAYWLAGGAAALLLARREGWKRDLPWFAAGSLAGAAAPVAALAAADPRALSAMVEQTLLMPLRTYHGAASHQVGYGHGWSDAVRAWLQHFADFGGAARATVVVRDGARLAGATVALLSFPAAALLLVAEARVARRDAAARRFALVAAAMTAALFLSSMHRPALVNLVWGFPAALVVLLHGTRRMGPRVSRALAATFGAAFAAGLLAAVLLPSVFAARTIALPAGTVRAYPGRDAEALELARDFHQRHLRSGERVFVYSYAALYYFLLRQPNATRYDVWGADLALPEQKQELLRALEATRPEWLLTDRTRQEGDPVAGWLESRYEPVAVAERLAAARRVR